MATRSKESSELFIQSLQQEIAELKDRIHEMEIKGSKSLEKLTPHSQISREELIRDIIQFRTIFQSSENPIVIYDQEARIVLANDCAVMNLKTTQEEILGKPLKHFLPETHDRTVKRINEVLQSEKVMHFEDEIDLPDGTHWFWSAMEPVYLSGDDQKFVQAISYDITERKITELALKQAEARYRTLFTNMSQGVIYRDSEGNVTDCNPAALRMLGLSKSQLIGITPRNPAWKVINEKGQLLADKDLPSARVIETGKPVQDITLGVFNPKIKDWVWLNVSAIPLLRNGKKILPEVFITLHDITNLKRTQRALEDSERRLLEISNQLPGAIYQFRADQSGNYSILFISEGATKLFNKSPEEVYDLQVLLNTIHPDDLENYMLSIRYSQEHMSP